ncbi:hypothetical protein Mapa_011847 [Marchantia paleacea]|nr:hypothetical protein Mapa_011847 [Marchantia paleacea]
MATKRQTAACPFAMSARCLVLFAVFVDSVPRSAGLVTGFYSSFCPNLEPIVKAGVIAAVQTEARLAASLMRLSFHDCFVNGCDASVLLDDTPTFTGEKTAPPNLNSLRGFEVVDSIKASVEAACPGVVSCADLISLIARDSVIVSNGPWWDVRLGRRDSLSASFDAVEQFIPNPNDDINTLKASFSTLGLSTWDLVSLSGAHTIGKVRCLNIVDRIYNFSGTGLPDPTIELGLLATLQAICPQGGDLNVTTGLDVQTHTTFDNAYYQNLVVYKGILNSDEVLFYAADDTQTIVQQFAVDKSAFFAGFTSSMIAMQNLNVLEAPAGEIRTNCRFVN